MGLVLTGVGVIGCLAGAGAALYGLTLKAQQPRLLPNTCAPSVPYESVEWKSKGNTVRGWLLTQPGKVRRPAIVVAHGWGSNRTRVLRYAEPLYDAGYTILMYDASGHGDSDPFPAPSGLMFRDDLLAALDWLIKRPEADPARIGVIGHSLGGFGSVLALEAGAPIAALVTDSMPVRISTMIGSELRRRKIPAFPLAYLIPPLMLRRSGIPRSELKRADPAGILARNAGKRRIPVFLVHSRKDSYVPSSELDHILARTPGLRHLYVEAEGHSSSEKDPAFWPEVLHFFFEHLRPDKENEPAASAASPSR